MTEPVLAMDVVTTTEPTTDNTTISLANFIADFGNSLLHAVGQQNPPIYDGMHHSDRAHRLTQLKRQPFPAQQNVIQAVTRLLVDEQERTAIINAEMGTGKTMMGVATAALLHAEGYARTLIISPPHLVYKWRREILETVDNARVWVLNGADALLKLIQLRNSCNINHSVPEFFILGRVRMRMGFHWRPAISKKPVHVRQFVDKYNSESASFVQTKILAACSDCGCLVKDANGNVIEAQKFLNDKRYHCAQCKAPLWTLTPSKEQRSSRDSVKKMLCQLPTLGEKRAEKLLTQFGENFLANLLSDNMQQFVNLLDEQGELIFSDRQAERMERALAKMELTFNQGNYQISEYVKRYLPKHYFSLLIVDEAHEFKGMNSAQGQAMGVIASQAQKILLLTGTLMGGYAEDVFHLLWRTMPQKMREDGYHYYRNSLHSANFRFMEEHGILKRVYKVREEDSFRTAKGKKRTVNAQKAPGFGPKGIARYVLPFTAFLKLSDMGGAILPPYQEHFIEVAMTAQQQKHYKQLESDLTTALSAALNKGDHALLGVVLNCLLAWPDCCFRAETVKHPRTRRLLAFVPTCLAEDEPSPKEAELIQLCLTAKAKGQRCLVYTLYTGTRDTTTRLKYFLEKNDLKTAVLRAQVASDKREDWIADRIEQGIDVLICNPELVKTGLDLLEFPNIFFMQSGYNVYTLMQASRRSWRIGQKSPVNVTFLGYRDTAQIACLSLMAKKIAVTQSTAGTMPETGLDILNSDDENIEVALARRLISCNRSAPRY